VVYEFMVVKLAGLQPCIQLAVLIAASLNCLNSCYFKLLRLLRNDGLTVNKIPLHNYLTNVHLLQKVRITGLVS
jgi:hypothetical protein